MTMTDEVRTELFQRNAALEEFLLEINAAFETSETFFMKKQDGREWPIVFIIGTPRSGTTLFLQTLASSGIISYPTNFMSRFYNTPTVGAMLQQMLADERFAFRDEFGDIDKEIAFFSNNGKTRGTLAPNEFNYVWKKIVPDDATLARVYAGFTPDDGMAALRRTFSAVASVFGKPFALKAIILNHRIDMLTKLAKRPLIVRMIREPEQVIDSILAARERQFGDTAVWYSYKVPEYSLLRDLAPEEQIAGQIHSLETAIEEGLKAVPIENKLSISYRQFCKDPRGTLDQVIEKLDGLGCTVGALKTLPNSFKVKTKVSSPKTLDALKMYW